MSHRTCLYYSNWSVYQKKHFLQDIPIHLVTNLFYAFIGIDESTGKVKLTDSWADLELPMPDGETRGSINMLAKLKRNNPALKVSMSIGGWGTSHLFRAVMSTKSKMENFISSALELCQKHQFDGIDIDWEYPENATEAHQLTELLKALRHRLGTSYLITVAAPAARDKINTLEVLEMDKYLSFWNLMCYDFTGTWSGKTGYHSNLFGHNGDNELNCNDVVQAYLTQGVSSPRKLVLGMPNYGRSFQCDSGTIACSFNGCGAGEEGIIPYKSLPIGKEEVDSRMVSAYCYDKEKKTLVVYDNPQTVRIKAMYIKLNNLGGGMWWESCGDDFQNMEKCLLNNFVDQLQS